MSRKIVLIIILAFIHLTVRADFYPRNWNVDIQHYTFRLNLSDDSNLIRGKASIDILFRDEVKFFSLDLINKNTLDKGMTISTLKVNGTESSFTHENNRITITPEIPFKKGQTIELEIVYEGVPADGLIISENKYGDRTFFGDNYPDRARNWLPSVDHPSDKASVDFIVEAPYAYEVIANGRLLEESSIDEGLKLTHWQEKAEISTKVMVIGAAKFAVKLSGMVRDIPVQAWVYPQNREEGFFDYSPAVKVLDYFDSHIGTYSYEKLANVQAKTRYGGMENASNIFYFENSVTGKGSIEPLIAHEIAHQWFGNSATEKDWHHVWLSEGFATYFTHLYLEHTYGVDLLRDRMKNDRQKIIDYFMKTPVPVVNTTIRDYNKILNTNSYQKGSWVLHMLRNEIGDEVFWEGIRKYYQKYQNGNALTEDFKNEMESVSSRDLDTFFNEWIFSPGQPDLNVSWSYKKGSKKLLVEFEQIQKESLFIFPMELRVQFANGESQNFKVNMTERSGSFLFECPELPVEFFVDPEVKLLHTINSISKQ